MREICLKFSSYQTDEILARLGKHLEIIAEFMSISLNEWICLFSSLSSQLRFTPASRLLVDGHTFVTVSQFFLASCWTDVFSPIELSLCLIEGLYLTIIRKMKQTTWNSLLVELSLYFGVYDSSALRSTVNLYSLYLHKHWTKNYTYWKLLSK